MISDTVSVVSGVEDPNTANNNATANVTVATATQADLAITSTASPNPITDGNNISYTQSVINNGPAASGTATFTDTIPSNQVSSGPPIFIVHGSDTMRAESVARTVDNAELIELIVVVILVSICQPNPTVPGTADRPRPAELRSLPT